MLFRLGIFAAVMLATWGAATAQVKVRIGDLAQSLNEIGSRAMIDQGIDRKYGIAAEYRAYPTLDGLFTAIRSKEVDVGFGGWTAIAQFRGKGFPVTMIFPVGRGVTVDVIVPTASPIKSIADLKGKKVGTFAGAAGTATVLFRVIASKFHGFDPGKTGDLQFAGPGLLPALLDKGEIDAAVMFDPLAAKLEGAGKYRSIGNLADAYKAGAGDDFLWIGYSTNDDFMKAEPEALTNFTRARLEALEYIKMSAFFAPGDVILNPFDRRCALGLAWRIERPGDHAFLAQSVLPHLGIGEHDQWITYAQQLLAAALENFGRMGLGSTSDLIAMLASGSVAELKLLCQGTAAARYFESGGEKMLSSILGTLAPAIGNLRLITALEGEPFSIRRWVRSGKGCLWLPYTANQVAALRGLISCWMNIAILETLSLAPDLNRQIWFHIDELDALGRIEGLKDAQARLRKFGGCVAIGFQSFSQVKAVYGEGAHTIIENCGNLLLLRCGLSEGGGTAELASDLIGSREVERDDYSRSRTRGRYTSRSTSMQSKQIVEEVALASEIMQLPNREGYVKKATAPGSCRVRFPYTDYPLQVAEFHPPLLVERANEE